MISTEIYFFRHAQTIWNLQRRFQGQKNSKLSENGIAQSKKMTEIINHINPDVFITSGLGRTKETLKYALENIKNVKAIYEFNEFNEAAFGCWEGMFIENVMKEYEKEFQLHKEKPHLFRLEGAETYYEVQSRTINGIKTLQKEFAGKKITVVTHGMVILCLIGYLRNIPIKNIREKVYIPDNANFIKTCWYS